MKIPNATYRIQFNPDFGFKRAESLISYLNELSISDIYASPVFKARHSSKHGYDVIDPRQINSELGSPKDFDDLNLEIKKYNMGWIQDIVPNHMAFDAENKMLMDVIENGTASVFYDYFDIEWNHPYESLKGKILVPFLGKFYGECLESGEIKLRYTESGLNVNYYELSLPLKIESYPKFFTQKFKILMEKLGKDHPDLLKSQGVLFILRNLPAVQEKKERLEQSAFAKSILWELYSTNQKVKEFIDESITNFNGEPGKPESFNLLDELLSDQLFRLSFWKVATEEINYRRFFNINHLISLRIEDENVFRGTHTLILNLLKENKFTGLRIDHIDGLYNPVKYLNMLKEAASHNYIVVEKILNPDEELPADWPVQGTTGYDFLNFVNGVFCDRKNDKRFDKIYSKFTRRIIPYDILVADTKRLIIGRHMAGDIDRLAHLLKNISSRDRYVRDITLYGIRRALVEILALFPVYRTYINSNTLDDKDKYYVLETVRKAAETNPVLLLELNFIEKFLLLEFYPNLSSEDKESWLQFVMRFQQLSGPLMAKGFEDTAMYIYNKFISLNEVGGSPNRFGVSPIEYHHFCKKRSRQSPHAMNATATHDTKRGEDIRARINVISEIPNEWENRVKVWAKINKSKKVTIKGKAVPDSNDEYFLYQTLVGAFPFDENEYPNFVERIKQYMIKSVREAKVHTAWLKPDEEYENGFINFIENILDKKSDNYFLNEFIPFQKKVAHYGVLNSISQVLLKITCPGVPDFYQGSELWDLNLVDPDNRRPIDFELRKRYLVEIKEREKKDLMSLLNELLIYKHDGKIKMFITYKSLEVRNKFINVFKNGDYIPLSVSGRHKNHILAFARNEGNNWIIAVVPRRYAGLISPNQLPLGDEVWGDTILN
ncbi:MAG: malto-oligosyltrehalose synthase, partial [Bacteroidetes bacterium]|nr:malto-oligosyltrehalose synthase [Bacteroidota bacterium]MBU1422740.1 malto-oligosyltrehalose synthase [Bacteroidota bacterium]